MLVITTGLQEMLVIQE